MIELTAIIHVRPTARWSMPALEFRERLETAIQGALKEVVTGKSDVKVYITSLEEPVVKIRKNLSKAKRDALGSSLQRA